MTATDPHLSMTPAGSAPAYVAPKSLAGRILAVLRIAFGFTFLRAFVDKLLALGYSTGTADDGTVDRFDPAAWIHGGSPTNGFPALAVLGAGDPWGMGRRAARLDVVRRFPILR